MTVDIQINRKFDFRIRSECENLLDFLTHRFTYLNRESWKQEILAGNILVNQSKTLDLMPLKEGDIVSYTPSFFFEPEVDFNFNILFQSNDFLIVNKTGNLPVHPAGRYRKNTLLNRLEENFPDLSFYPAHRLDRETSGIQIFTLNPEKASIVQSLFEKQRVLKEYIVYVHGNIYSKFVAEGYLSKDLNSPIRKKRNFSTAGTGETCKTTFEPIESKNGITKLLAFPETGRLHQIRATLQSLGFPIVGDKLYGTDENRFLELLKGKEFKEFGIARQALHAKCISFSLSERESFVFHSPEPEDMAGILI